MAPGTVANVDERVTKHANGTLTPRDVGITRAQVGLDVLPYAKGARLLQTEARLVAFEVANHVGMAVVVALRTREEIAQTEDGDIPALAEQYRALLALEKATNPGDPELAQRRAEIAEVAQRIRDTTREVDQGRRPQRHLPGRHAHVDLDPTHTRRHGRDVRARARAARGACRSCEPGARAPGEDRGRPSVRPRVARRATGLNR